MWVATVDNIDWPSKPGLSVSKAKAELAAIFAKAEALHLNAVVFQVRPSCDALYPSKLEPWSEYLTGRQGRAPSPLWDPLQFAIDQAHQRGIELHAWFNPYRARHFVQKGPCSDSHISNTRPDLCRQYGRFKWLDPGEPDVRAYTEAVIMDVVDRYDIDGVHLDDYFYPYPEADGDKRDIPFPDDGSYATYRATGGSLARSDWRRNNVDTLIEEIYAKVKARKRWVKFGISPFGIYRPGIPAGIRAGIDQYDTLYADCRKWLREGWCDYMVPQLYWKIAQTAQSYPKLLNWWVAQNPKGRLVAAGNFTSRLRPNEGHWPAKEILDEIRVTRNTVGAGGNVHFSMKPFLEDAGRIDEALIGGPYRSAALPPAMPWLDAGSPRKPEGLDADRGGLGQVRWRQDRDFAARWWVTYFQARGRWQVSVLPGWKTQATLNVAGATKFGVAAVDRCGVEGPTAWTNLAGR